MSSRTIFLARLGGLFLIGVSLPMFLNRASLVDTLAAIVHQPALLLTFGMIALAAGLAMVIGHNLWSGGVAPVVVTILGWVVLIKGLLCLVLPATAIASLYGSLRISDFYSGFAGGYLLVGLYLAYAGFRPAASREPATSPPASA